MTNPTRARGAAARRRSLRTARAYRIAQTVEALRGDILELEVVLRDVALSGEASNENLAAELVEAAGHVFKTALHLERACQGLSGEG